MTADNALEQPAVQRIESAVGKGARFRHAAAEVERIHQVQKNYYAVLKVSTSTSKGDISKNYDRLKQILDGEDATAHVEKELVAEAKALSTQAHATLTNPLKKSLYNRFLEEQQAGPSSGQLYEEWEEAQASDPPHVPEWANRILGVPGGGLLLLCLCFPLTLVIFILLAVVLLVLLPFRWLTRCLAGRHNENLQQGPSSSAAV